MFAIEYNAKVGESIFIPMVYVCSIENSTNKIRSYSMVSKFNAVNSSVSITMIDEFVHFLYQVPDAKGKMMYS